MYKKKTDFSAYLVNKVYAITHFLLLRETVGKKGKIFKSPRKHWAKLNLATQILQIIDRPLKPH